MNYWLLHDEHADRSCDGYEPARMMTGPEYLCLASMHAAYIFGELRLPPGLFLPYLVDKPGAVRFIDNWIPTETAH